MLGDRELSFDQYLAIVKRRLWWIITPIILVPGIVYLASLLVPNEYTSQTLVLVEQQKVPDNFVKPVVTEELNERLETMQEQILSRTRLQPLIERFDLFPKDIGKVPMEDLVDRMRKLISVTGVRADFGSRAGGLPGFYISFTGRDPRQAQQVCSEITSMFMQENLRAREQTAQGTTEFLTSQLNEAKRKLDDQDSKLATFKQKYIGQLPEQEQTNLSVLGTLSTQLDAVNQALARGQQDRAFLQALLADRTAAWQNSPVKEYRNDPKDDQKELAALESQLTILQARYTADYPDVIKTQNEIAQLKKQMGVGSTAIADPAKEGDKPTLAETKPMAGAAKEGDEPTQGETKETDKAGQAEVKSTAETTNDGNRPAQAETKPLVEPAKDSSSTAQLETKPKIDPAKVSSKPSLPEPIEIRQIRMQIHQIDETQTARATEQGRLQQQIRVYQARVQMSPVVEEEYKALTRDHQAALNFYNDLLAKQTQSEMATDLEKKQQGEQFRVMDPPNLPEKPTWPNRPHFALAGLAGGIGLGVGLAFIFEMQDKTLRTEEDILFYLKLPVLTNIATMSPTLDGKGRSSDGSAHEAEAGVKV